MGPQLTYSRQRHQGGPLDVEPRIGGTAARLGSLPSRMREKQAYAADVAPWIGA